MTIAPLTEVSEKFKIIERIDRLIRKMAGPNDIDLVLAGMDRIQE